MKARKLPYYARSVVALATAGRPRAWWRAFAPAGHRRVVLRTGLDLELGPPLDLLILKETALDDAYGVGAVEADAPRLVVDVGASFGSFALLAATTLPQARVLAFEADPEVCARLDRNVRRNRVRNVDARCVTVGAGAPLDDLVGDEPIDLLKIDCEGCELDVLQSLSPDRLRATRRIVLEYHRDLLPAADARVGELLVAHGFAVTQRPDPYDPAIGYITATGPGRR